MHSDILRGPPGIRRIVTRALVMAKSKSATFPAREITPWSDPVCPDRKSGNCNINVKSYFLNIRDFKYKVLGT